MQIAMKHILIGSLLVASLALPAGAQQTRVLTADRSNDYGLVYTLPTTALSVSVCAEREVSRRGPFYQYAKKYLGTDKAVVEDSEKWRVKSVEVTPYGVADTETKYQIQFKPGSVGNIAVADNGMLLAINARPDFDQPQSKSGAPRREAVLHGNPDKDFLEFVNEDFVAAQSTAKQAEMLAESLMEVREAKLSLTRGTADPMPTDGRQLELMLASLARQEETMTQAFTGVRWTETETRTYDVVPEESGSSILCRLSEFAGFTDPDDLSGDPVEITVEVIQEGETPTDGRGLQKRMPKDAVIYNLPGSALVTLAARGEEIYQHEFEFSQFGTSFGLNPLLFTDKREPYGATFDPATGAVREIKTLSAPQP